jgi:hypothetical protein
MCSREQDDRGVRHDKDTEPEEVEEKDLWGREEETQEKRLAPLDTDMSYCTA